MTIRLTSCHFVSALLTLTVSAAAAAEPPAVGKTAPNFTLNTLDARPVELNQLTAKSPVVLVVLRGWPGYQCPLCTRQVNEFVPHAADFASTGARVVMVYPGPAENLHAHANEFLRDKNWPKDFIFVTDPDCSFVNAYGLRWAAKGETAYPSTFILDKKQKVRFAHISKEHGDRVSAESALQALREMK